MATSQLLFIQSDEPNRWLPASEWQTTVFNQVRSTGASIRTLYMGVPFDAHIIGTSLDPAFPDVIDGEKVVLVNSKTGRSREFLLLDLPTHTGIVSRTERQIAIKLGEAEYEAGIKLAGSLLGWAYFVQNDISMANPTRQWSPTERSLRINASKVVHKFHAEIARKSATNTLPAIAACMSAIELSTCAFELPQDGSILEAINACREAGVAREHQIRLAILEAPTEDPYTWFSGDGIVGMLRSSVRPAVQQFIAQLLYSNTASVSAGLPGHKDFLAEFMRA